MEGLVLAIIFIVWGFLFGFTSGINFLASDLSDQNRISATEYYYIKSWRYIIQKLNKYFTNNDSE